MTFNRALFSSASGDWETPQELFDELDREFEFNLDACAQSGNAKCHQFYTIDSLNMPWRGFVFCNPPYGREIGKWVRKGLLESKLGSTVVMLLPARTDTRWFHSYILGKAEIRFLKGRLRFSGHKNSAPFPSCIVVFRSGMTRFSGPTGPEGGDS